MQEPKTLKAKNLFRMKRELKRGDRARCRCKSDVNLAVGYGTWPQLELVDTTWSGAIGLTECV